MQVTITLTSPVIREENMRDGGWEVVKDVTYFSPVFLLLSILLKMALRSWKATCWHTYLIETRFSATSLSIEQLVKINVYDAFV